MVIEFEDRTPQPRRVPIAALVVGGIVVVVLAIVVTLLAQKRWSTVKITQESMFPTLLHDEFVMVDCAKGQSYKQNQVVLITPPDLKGMVVKRIIAVGGQVVQWKGGVLSVDGGKLVQNEPDQAVLADSPAYKAGMDRADKRVAVGQGKVFVIGDNWNQSFDSFDYGPIDLSAVKGTVRSVYWPMDKRREIH